MNIHLLRCFPSMAELKASLPTIAVLLLGLLLDEVGGSAQGSSISAVKSHPTENVKAPNEHLASSVQSWSQVLRHFPKEKQFLNPKTRRNEEEDLDTITAVSTRQLPGFINAPAQPKLTQADRKFKAVSSLPATPDRQDDEVEEFTIDVGSPRKDDAKSINPLSTNVSSDVSNVVETQGHSRHHHDASSRECTHNVYNESASPLKVQASSDSSYARDVSSTEEEVIGKTAEAWRNSREPYQSDHHPALGIAADSEVEPNYYHSRDRRSIREEANVENDIGAEKMKTETVEKSDARRKDEERHRQAFNVQGFLLQRKPDEIIEVEVPRVTEGGRAGTSSQLGRSENAEKNAPKTSTGDVSTGGSNIRPQHEKRANLAVSNLTFQTLASSSSSSSSSVSHPHPGNSFHVTNESLGHRSKTAGRTEELNVVSPSSARSEFFSLPHVMRRRRRRRWGQRPRRPPGGSNNSPFGRSRSRDGNAPSRSSSGRPPPLLPYRPRGSPDAQDVSLKVIVELRMSRDYERILRSAIQERIVQREFRPMLRYINPTWKLVLLRRDQPRDILKAFCEDILEMNTTTVFQLINPFFHSRSWSSAQYVANLLATLNIPVITWGPEYIGSTDKTKSEKMQLNISPTLHHQARAMLDVLKYYEWSNFAVVYTEVPGHDIFLSVLRVLVKTKQAGKEGDGGNFKFGLLAEVRVSNTSNPLSTLDDIKTLTKTEARIILLYCKEAETLSILKEAETLGLLEREYVWILTFEALNKNKKQNANNFPVGLLGLQYTYRDQAMKDAIETAVAVWLRGLQQSVLSTATTSTGAPNGLPWKLPSLECNSPKELLWQDGKKFYNFLKNVSYDDVSFNPIGQLHHAEISLFNVQWDHEGDTRKRWTEVGQWTSDGVQIQQITWPGGGRTPPRGKPERHYLRIVTREEPPFVVYRNRTFNETCGAFSLPCAVYERDENETRLTNSTIVKCCTGLSIDLLGKLSSALDFDFYLYEVEDFQWGSKTETGEWDGIVGEVRSGRADMAVASMTIDEDKSTAVNFSFPYMETGITFMVAIRDGAISATAFLEPYDYPAWCIILLCSVHVTGASIFLFEWVSPYGLDYGHRMSNKYRFSLFRAFWLMWAMLFGAAVSTDSPRGVSSKFTTNIWALFALVFTASYTANLAAFMITKEEFYTLTGMQDWKLQNPYAVKPQFRFATVPNSTAESNIKKNNPTMYKYMKQFGQVSVEHALEALKDRRLEAFIYDASVLEYQEGKDEDCKLITVGNWYATTSYGVAFPPGSHWLGRVNKVIMDLHYEGELERLKEFWLAGACHTKRKKTTNSRGIGNGVSSTTLGILNFTSAFIFLAAGTGLAAIVFVTEHFLFWLGRKKLSAWDKKGCCALISLSMGMSMSFRDSVKEAMEAHRKAKAIKCKSAICETRLWKANFELRQAREQIDKLQMTLLSVNCQDNGASPEMIDAICCHTHEQGESSKEPSRAEREHSTPHEKTNGRNVDDDEEEDEEDEEKNVRVTLL